MFKGKDYNCINTVPSFVAITVEGYREINDGPVTKAVVNFAELP